MSESKLSRDQINWLNGYNCQPKFDGFKWTDSSLSYRGDIDFTDDIGRLHPALTVSYKELIELGMPEGNEPDYNGIERNIEMALENCACLGRDAYGEYIAKLKKGLINSIKNLK